MRWTIDTQAVAICFQCRKGMEGPPCSVRPRAELAGIKTRIAQDYLLGKPSRARPFGMSPRGGDRKAADPLFVLLG
jgi:hypothetical protein